jgi:hypothetical protein
MLCLRPHYSYQNGTLRAVAASNFNNIMKTHPEFLPPLCPHSANPERNITDTQMTARKITVLGQTQWVFECQGHHCGFQGQYKQICIHTNMNVLFMTHSAHPPTAFIYS